MAGWTQTPNFIYDLMPDMKEAELKVVMLIVRKTVGWQAERVKLRMADIEKETGLSHPSVATGIKNAMDRGILARKVDGDTYSYWLIEPQEGDAKVKIFNTETTNEGQEVLPESKNSLPSSVKNLNNDELKILTPNTKDINTNKPKRRRGGAKRPKSPPPPKHPAVEVFHEKHHRWPNDSQQKAIADVVTDLGLWRCVLDKWHLRDYRPTNIEGQLDWYQHPEKMSSPNGAHNGKHSGQNSGDYQRPAVAAFDKQQWDEFLSARDPAAPF